MSKERELLKKCAAQLNGTLNGTTSMRLAEEIEKRLAEPEPEPVVWQFRTFHSEYTVCPGWDVWENCTESKFNDVSEHVTKGFYQVRKLYTAPPKQEPLSDEEINECMENSASFGFNGDVYIADGDNAFENFARAIEKAHGIGVK